MDMHTPVRRETIGLQEAWRAASTAYLATAALFLAACGSTGPDVDPNAVDRVEVQPAVHTLQLNVSGIVQLNAIARNKSGTELTGKVASWRSASTGVASVSLSGVVTAVGLGTAVITATVEGIEGSATITVMPPPVATVTVGLAAGVLVAGGTTTASAVLRDAAGNTLTDRQVGYNSSNPAVATVSNTGVVNAVGTGTTSISATSETQTSATMLCVLATAPNLHLDHVTVSQAIQNPAGTIPLVDNGLPAEIRVFATGDADLPPGCQRPRFRTIVYHGQVEISREESDAAIQLPLVVDEATPVASFVLPGERITSSVRLLVELDPHDVIPESGPDNNRWPASGIPASLTVASVPPLELRFIPVLLTNGGSVGRVDPTVMSEYLFATRQMYPVSTVDADIAETFSTSVTFGSGEQGPWVQMLQELDVKRVVEASRRYYVGSVRPPPGVSSTQFGGFGYIPFNLASTGAGTRTSVLVGVGWANRQRFTTETVAHELGHNHGRRHAPCGGPAGVDAAYPFPGATIGFPGSDMYTYSLNNGAPPQLLPFSNFDIMSYCTPVWISDYNYLALLNARLTAGPVAATIAARPGPPCECLVVWGSIDGDSMTLNPAFVTRTMPQLPPNTGSFILEGVREDGGVPFSYAFEPAEIDHAPGVRHFAFAIPIAPEDRESLALLRVRGQGRTTTIDRTPVMRDLLRQAAAGTSLRVPAAGAGARLSWPREMFRGALVRNARTGAVLAISYSGTVTLDGNVNDVDVTLSDGVRSETIRVRR